MSGVNVFAFDDGYGDNKLYSGKEPLLISSHVTRYKKKMKNESEESSKETKQQKLLNHLGVEIDDIPGEQFLVGEGALREDPSIRWSGGADKHQDGNFPILAKTCLAVMAGQQNNVEVNPLVMGLPVLDDEDPNRHENLERMLKGMHEVTLIEPDGTRVVKTIHVQSVVTKKQPFGTFADLLLGKNGEIRDKELANQFNVIVDIGTRTLNVLTLDSLEPVNGLSDTIYEGVSKAYDEVNGVIKEKFNAGVTSGKISQVCKDKEIKGYDLTEVVQHAYKRQAQVIANEINTMFIDSWAYVDNLIITGGGAEEDVMRPYLEGKFPVEPKFKGRFTTVQGFWKTGVRHAVKAGAEEINLPTGGKIKVKEE